jgi:hypothetical protein
MEKEHELEEELEPLVQGKPKEEKNNCTAEVLEEDLALFEAARESKG